MPTKTKLGKLKETIIIGRMLRASLVALAIFSLAFVLIPTLISEASATTNLSASVLWSGISLTLDPDYNASSAYDSSSGASGSQIGDAGHGDIAFGTITPTSNNGDNKGTMRVAKKTIGITTSGKYYAVYLSMANPVSGTTVNDLLLDGTTNIPIPAIGDGSTTGTWSNPIAFSGSAWGYAVPGSPITNGFDSSSAYSAYPLSSASNYVTSDLTHTNSSTIYNTTKWAAVPVVDNASLAQMIWKQETENTKGFGIYENDAGTTITGDTEHNHFDIYFATMVDTDTIAGEYSNSIVYTALASARSLDQISTNVKRDKAFGGAGDTVHLEFDLATSASDLSANNLTVAIVKHSVASLIDGDLTNSSLSISSSDYVECTSIENVTFTENGASLDCVLPESIDGILGKGDGKGEYDFWIKINNYGYNYLSRYKDGSNNLVASFTYAGLQSTTDAEGENPVVTEMQQMSGGVCRNTNMWGSYTGEDSQIYDYLGEEGNNPLLAAGTDTIGVSSFFLIDNRDDQNYLIRRLADEKCWMVQNLDLDLAAVANGDITLDNTNTDLNSKTSWTPDTTTLTSSFIDATTARTYDNGWDYITASNRVASDSAWDSSHASRYIGYYYNFYAMTTQNREETSVGPTENSICAKNWRVPTPDHHTALLSAYSITADSTQGVTIFASTPLNYYAFGTIDTYTTGARTYAGTAGLYFEAFVDSSGSIPSLDYNTSRGYIESYMLDNRARGKTIRCVARD